ncbi:MAG: hypothetical protein ACRC33_09345 [Gemmataceae bacterium]
MNRDAWAMGLVVILLAGGVGSSDAQEGTRAKGSLAVVEKAWLSRQERFQSVQMRWTTRDTYVKGGLSKVFASISNGKGGVQPDRDTTFEVPAEFALGGDKARYAYQGWVYHLNESRFNAEKFVTTFDGSVTIEFYPERSGNHAYPLGRVVSKGAFESARGAFMRPLVLFFRPLKPEFFGMDLTTFTVVNTTAKVRDVSCWELQHRRGKSAYHLWTDPTRDHVAVKLLVLDSGLPGQLTEMRYRNDPLHGWVPEEWGITFTDRQGSVYQTQQTRVTSLTVAAPPSSSFALTFSSGTRVKDQLASEEWIVRPDGTRRMITKADGRLSYDEIVRADGAQTARFVREWLKPSLLLMGLGCLALAIWRIARRRFDQAAEPTGPRPS